MTIHDFNIHEFIITKIEDRSWSLKILTEIINPDPKMLWLGTSNYHND